VHNVAIGDDIGVSSSPVVDGMFLSATYESSHSKPVWKLVLFPVLRNLEQSDRRGQTIDCKESLIRSQCLPSKFQKISKHSTLTAKSKSKQNEIKV